jgi:phospholipid/cholesterol/gamma-HCH transport system substrate-binding protein
MKRMLRVATLTAASALVLSGCGFSPYDLPLPGGADLGSHPYTVKVHFRDVLDLVPQSGVRVNDIAVGKVTDIKLDGWTALVTLKINKDAKLPDNAEATIRQTSLLGEKFVSLEPPATGAHGRLSNGDVIPLDRSGRNPEIEEVFGAASLLFNGGGLEKTNTIIRELNKTLGGNEPEIKQLIASSASFIGQLDDNKQALLASLEKVNRLAVAANNQKSAIAGALDDLPSALRVVNGQRHQLVKLLESLHRLSDVATGVIRDSKADTVADLKDLAPILQNLAAAGDNLAYASKALLSYPFTDGFLGNTYAAASGKCEDATSSKPAVKQGACFGDYANLSLHADISAKQLTSLLGGFAPAALNTSDTTAPSGSTKSLVDLVSGLVPSSDTSGLDLPGASSPSGTPSSTPTPSGGLHLPAFCSLLGKCRTAVASATSDDLGRILVEPAVAP